VIRVGILAVLLLAGSALAVDPSFVGRLREYETYLQSNVHSRPDGDPTNRWSVQGAPPVDPVSGGEANQASIAFRVSCASVIQPQPPTLQCATRLRRSR
jgi:hypothetical protein